MAAPQVIQSLINQDVTDSIFSTPQNAPVNDFKLVSGSTVLNYDYYTYNFSAEQEKKFDVNLVGINNLAVEPISDNGLVDLGYGHF